MLADSLKKALRTKPFSKVTVSEIVADCGVNRKTFYYHFEDIYALLKWTIEEDMAEILNHFNLFTDYEKAMYYVLDYAEQNEHLINCLYDAMGRDEMRRFLRQDFTDILLYIIRQGEEKCQRELNDAFRQFLSVFLTEAIAGVLIDYIRGSHTVSKEHLVAYVGFIVKSTLVSIMEGEGQGAVLCPGIKDKEPSPVPLFTE